jgi:hypothetical protein
MAFTKAKEMVTALNLSSEELPELPADVVTRFPEMKDWWNKVLTVLQRKDEAIEQAVNAVYDVNKRAP